MLVCDHGGLSSSTLQSLLILHMRTKFSFANITFSWNHQETSCVLLEQIEQEKEPHSLSSFFVDSILITSIL